jgi:hypothetical protein
VLVNYLGQKEGLAKKKRTSALCGESRPEQRRLIGMAEFNVEGDIANVEGDCLEIASAGFLGGPTMCAYRSSAARSICRAT